MVSSKQNDVNLIIERRINMKKKLLIIFLVVLPISCIVFFFMITLSLRNNHSFVTAANMNAKVYYKYFTNGQINLNVIDNFGKDGTFYIYGECTDYESFTAYSGDVVKENKLIYGFESPPTNYWAIKVHNGTVVAAWSSNFPLKEEQLVAYSIEEQEKQANLFDKSTNTKIIGYYEYKSNK